MIKEETGIGLFGGVVKIKSEIEQEGGIGGFINRVLDYVLQRDTGTSDIYRYGPVNIVLSNDSSKLVKDRFQILLSNAAAGLALVLLVLGIFLSIRMAFWVAMGIPVAVMGVIFLLPNFDAFLNSATLVSLVLLVGIIDSDASVCACGPLSCSACVDAVVWKRHHRLHHVPVQRG